MLRLDDLFTDPIKHRVSTSESLRRESVSFAKPSANHNIFIVFGQIVFSLATNTIKTGSLARGLNFHADDCVSVNNAAQIVQRTFRNCANLLGATVLKEAKSLACGIIVLAIIGSVINGLTVQNRFHFSLTNEPEHLHYFSLLFFPFR